MNTLHVRLICNYWVVYKNKSTSFKTAKILTNVQNSFMDILNSEFLIQLSFAATGELTVG